MLDARNGFGAGRGEDEHGCMVQRSHQSGGLLDSKKNENGQIGAMQPNEPSSVQKTA